VTTTESDDDDQQTADDGQQADAGTEEAETVQCWLVERTYSDDELNLIILTYATPDGERYYRKERALPSFTGPARTTRAAVDVDPGNLGAVNDPAERERYATEARRMRETHDPAEAV
jgi:hypothetical protein